MLAYRTVPITTCYLEGLHSARVARQTHETRLQTKRRRHAVDIEDRMKQLQLLFTQALSGAVSAKARYLSIAGDRSSTPAAVARAKMAWQQLEVRKTMIIARMVALEEMEQESVA